MSSSQMSLDDILKEIGDFGKYQHKVIFLISFACVFIYFRAVIWIFETKQQNYRCEIIGCETYPIEYKPPWWTEAIPSINNEPSQCEKYKVYNTSNDQKRCTFDNKVVEFCDKYVYKTTETSILTDFHLHCNENIWKLTSVGTINSAGLFVGLPIFGFLSNKFGRKTIFLIGMTVSSILGVVRSFSNSYIFFVILEFLESASGAASYPALMTIGMELVNPSKRSLITVSMSIVCAVSGALTGGLAWILLKWRLLDQIWYGASFLTLTYYWLLPESVRWLLVNKKYKDVENTLQNISKTNKTNLSQESLRKLFNSTESENTNTSHPLRELLKSYPLIKRVIHCSICWICCIFTLKGLTVYSVSLSDNSYLDFILTVLVEFPGGFAAYLLVDRIGRRNCLGMSFFITGISCLSFIFIPEDLYWLKLSLYLFGKFGTSISVIVMYTITSELFPTNLRATLLSICSMVGRIGAMVAPQAPLLELYWLPLPLTLFSAAAVLGTILSLLLPETTNKILPNTIKEGEKIETKP